MPLPNLTWLEGIELEHVDYALHLLAVSQG